MRLRRKLGMVAVMAIVVGTSVALTSVGPASASGGPAPSCGGCGTGGGGGGLPGGGGGGGGGNGGPNAVLKVTDNCGGTLDLRERTPGSLVVTIAETGGPDEVWSLRATQQDYGVTTGGRVGAPIDLVPTTMPSLAFSAADGALTTTATILDTPDLTHGFSYVATEISPSPQTCVAQGFWTNGTTVPEPMNPAAKPDSAPALTGATEADTGTNDVLLQFDQEMLDTAQGIPAAGQLTVTVDGVARAVTGETVLNDSPPNLAVLDVSVDGPALVTGQTVDVQYTAPTPDQPALQDMDGLLTTGFGPVAVPVF